MDPVAGLDTLDRLDVGRVEQLRAELRVHQPGRAPHGALDAGGHGAVPVRTGDQEVSAAIAIGAGADVVDVVGVEIDQLQRVVAAGFDRGQRDDERLRPQIHDQEGIRRVRVGRDHPGVRRREDPGDVVHLVRRTLVLAPVRVQRELVDAEVVLDDWERVDVGLASNAFRLIG